MRKYRLHLITLLLTVFYCTAVAQQKGVIAGRVVAEDGGGIPNMTVTISVTGSFRSGNFRSVATDDEGNFRFTNLEPRSYTIGVAPSRGYTNRH